MAENTKENLEQLKNRVKGLEQPSHTSPIFSKTGVPITIFGIVLLLIQAIIPGVDFFKLLVSWLLVAIGLVMTAIGYFSLRSEEVEKTERERRIKERSKIQRCLYLEGNVPEGQGSVGYCRLYDFDMVDYPYCIYCRDYSPGRGSPKI